jgi:cytidyltransferase-like protein
LKRIFVDMSVCLLHHGHVRLLQKARELGGHVVVILTSDEEVLKYKGYPPELNFEERKEVLLALKSVDEVIAGPWLVTDEFLQEHKADCLVHSGPNFNDVFKTPLVSLERTESVSSEDLRARGLNSIVIGRNSQKALLTPGPTNLHPENLLDIQPVFSRSDEHYQEVTARVLESIRALAGQDTIAAVPGSATTAIEVATSNFLNGHVLVLTTGYYSRRILEMVKLKQQSLALDSVENVDWATFEKMSEENAASDTNKFDWVVCAYTETADAFALDLKLVKKFADAHGARLMVDATGSINLEDNHELADVAMFSSNKGLGGLTGAGFITFNKAVRPKSGAGKLPFILDLNTYLDKLTTSPAHTLLSLDTVSTRFAEHKNLMRQSKRQFMEIYREFLVRPEDSKHQPYLCTKVQDANIELPEWIVGYQPRTVEPGCQVVCHLFEQYPSNRAVGDVYRRIKASGKDGRWNSK